MRVSYFPGCHIKNYDTNYEKSLDVVCKQLGVETEEVLNWSCCGGEAGERLDLLTRVAYPLRNLAVSEKLTKNPVLFTPCPHCYRAFSFSRHFMENGDGYAMDFPPHTDAEEIKNKSLQAIGLPYSGKTEIKNLLEIFEEHQASAKIKKFLLRDLKGLKVVAYYGCKTIRPSVYTEDLGDPEKIDLMEKYLKSAGAEPLPWRHATTCNGSYLTQSAPEEGLRMTAEILKEALHVGAEAIVVICPICFHNLDALQRDALRLVGERAEIPVFYLTELLAVAMGANIAKLDWTHTMKIDGVFKKLGLAVGKK